MIKRTATKWNRLSVTLFVTLVLVLAVGAVAGLFSGYEYLKSIWQEQCRVTDRELDVVITSTGKMVHPDVITYHFGLTNGANLAVIPFAELRSRLLTRVPNIRELKIERRLPNRVTIEVIEREPIARLASAGMRTIGGRVVDEEGVVFRFSNNVSLLPVIRESSDPPTPPGRRLTGSAVAALQLVAEASGPDLADLHVLEINTSKPDYLLLTLGDYSRAKIAWNQMGSDTRLARDSLKAQLTNLKKAITSKVSPWTTEWIATDWEKKRIYANDPSRSGAR